MSLAAADRVRGALWGIFLADALSMPVHWFYDVGEIDRRFGRVVKYEPPSEPHQFTFLKLSEGSPVGEVILKGKTHHYGVPNRHCHHGLQAGENTLNSQCARVVIRGITANQGVYSGPKFLQDYVDFMTTEGTHNDVYAEEYHRNFFAKYAKGIPAAECCGDETDGTSSIGSFVTLPPVVFASLHSGADSAVRTTLEHLHWTHRSELLDKHAEAYIRLLVSVVQGADLRESILATGTSIGVDVADLAKIGAEDDRAVIGKAVGTQCNITQSLPAVLFLAYKYAGNPQAAIVANTNCGGENCHRGSALGALVGAASGTTGFESYMFTDLVAREQIESEINAFVQAIRL